MNKPNPTRTLIRGAGIAFSGNLLAQILYFVYNIPVVRLLGPDRNGVLGVISTIIGLVGELALFGLGNGIMYYLSRACDQLDEQEIKNVVTSASKIVSTASGVALLVIATFALLFAEDVYPFPNIRSLLLVSSLGIPLTAFWGMGQAIFRAVRKAEFVYKPIILSNILQLLLIPFLIWASGGDLFVVVVANLVVKAVPIYYGVRLFDRNILSLKQLLRLSYVPYTRQLLHFSWPLLISAYFWNTGKRIDVLFIGYFLGEHEAGIYRPALALSSILWFVPMALTYLLFPIMSSLLEQRKESQFLNISDRAFKYILYINVPIACFFVIFSEQLMTVLFGAEFAGGSDALSILSIAVLLQSFYVISNYIIYSQKRTKISMWISIATAGANLIGIYCLTPRYGIEGTALAVLFSYLLMMTLAMVSSARLIGRMIFPHKTLGVLCFGAIAVLSSAFCGSGALFGQIVIYAAFIVGCFVWLVIFERQELDLLTKLFLSKVQSRWRANL